MPTAELLINRLTLDDPLAATKAGGIDCFAKHLALTIESRLRLGRLGALAYRKTEKRVLNACGVYFI